MDVIVVGDFVMALTMRVPRILHAGESLFADLLDVGPGGKRLPTRAPGHHHAGWRSKSAMPVLPDMSTPYQRVIKAHGVMRFTVFSDPNGGLRHGYAKQNNPGRIRPDHRHRAIGLRRASGSSRQLRSTRPGTARI
jgi:hypothetical protein